MKEIVVCVLFFVRQGKPRLKWVFLSVFNTGILSVLASAYPKHRWQFYLRLRTEHNSLKVTLQNHYASPPRFFSSQCSHRLVLQVLQNRVLLKNTDAVLIPGLGSTKALVHCENQCFLAQGKPRKSTLSFCPHMRMQKTQAQNPWGK